MKKTYLMFALLLSLMGVNGALAQTVVNEGFEDWTSAGVADGWLLINGATYGNSYTYDYVVGSTDFTPKSGTKCLGNSSHSAEQGTTASPMIVTPPMTGTFTFKFRKYNSSSSTKGYINVFEYDENTGAATGSSVWTCRPNGINEATSNYQDATINVGTTAKRYAIYLAKVSIDDLSFTGVDAATDGPALKVTGATDGALNFGMVNPGATKTLTLSNPGTESITVNIATTGGFTANPTTATIAAGEQQTLTISAPETTATGEVTITPTVSGVDAVTVTLSATVKDPSKVFETLATGSLPEDWTSTSWSFTTGYAYTSSWYESSNARLITPLLTVKEGEVFMIEAMGTYSGYQTFFIEYSTDKTNWTKSATAITLGSDWATYSVSDIPAGKYYIAIHASQARVRNFYGGEYDNTPTPKLAVEGIANGGSLSWGYADVPAGSTKTITLKNDGTADLDVTIAATDDYTVDPAAATVEANGGTVAVTIGTPAHDGNGVLTITPAEGSGLSPYTINLTSYYKEPKPVMAIDKTAIAFGRVNEVKTETVTVSNSGDADLVATIANDNTENFTVSTESLTVAPGETGTFTVTYNYAEGSWGTFTANIKVTPNYGSTYDVKTITASATSKDPNVWDEDFEEGSIPETWTNEGGWTVSTPTASGNNGTKMATISSYNNPKTLTTPRLAAKAGDVLSFYIGMQYDDEPLTIEYSNDDRATWNVIEDGVASYTASGDIAFTAPADGKYFLRFTGTFAMLDNFSGFKLDLPAADAVITASSLPATGNQFVAYNTSVTVENKGTEAQVAVAKLFVNGEEKASDEAELAVAASATIDLSFVPEEAITDGTATIEVTLKDVEDFAAKTVVATINITAAPVIDETAENSFTTGTLPVAVLNYTPKNGWNTIGVPFQLTNDILTTIFGEGWKAYELTGYSNNEISFSQTTNFVAGYPYIIYAEAAPQEASFKLENLNISSASEREDVRGGLAFRSTFAPIAPGQLTDWWGVTNQGRIQPAGSGASLKALRGYFYTSAAAPETNLSEARIVYINLDGTVTAISSVKAQLKADGNTYDLSGRKLTGNLKQGVYIQNGKKIVIK